MWLLFSFLAAFSVATKDVYSKKAVLGANKYLVVWAMNVFSIPLLFIGAGVGLFHLEFASVDTTFWYAMIVGVVVNILALILYFQSVKLSPISYVIPLMAFVPVFSVPVSYIAAIFLPGAFKTVSLIGFCGIFLIFVGAYLLNMKEIADKGVFFPIKMLFKEKGSMLMIMVSFLWSISAIFDGIAVHHSSPMFYLVVMTIVTSVIMTFILFIKMKGSDIKEQLSNSYTSLFGVALFNIMGMAFYLIAIGLTTKIPYVLAIRSVNLLIVTVLGYMLFKEKNIMERAVGTCFMVGGLALIAIFSR
ncbi:MAG TPA: EamA family transporter [Victivallales bacterium]|nr:EamA family transporter [Victivallales bacterium]